MSEQPNTMPVVFIPALLCDEQLYRDVVAALGDGIEPLVLQSPKPRLEDSVADILSRAPSRFALVGTSYGGNLAMEVALAAPDAVFDLLAGLVVHKAAVTQAATFKATAKRVGGSAGAAQARALGVRREASSRLGALTMPAFVPWGNEDALVPVAIGRALAAALPQAQFEGFEGCGHLPTLEKPVESAASFARFLKAAAAQGH